MCWNEIGVATWSSDRIPLNGKVTLLGAQVLAMSSRGGSQRISATAHYTGHVWVINNESDPSLSTSLGKCLYSFVRHTMLVSWLEGWLLARHRLIDHRLASAIESGEVSQIIEIAAGLSPRGWRFRKRYGDRITYVETDLAGILEYKRSIFDRLKDNVPPPIFMELDVLAASGPSSLEAVCDVLDPRKGTAMISEGLLIYLDEPDLIALWTRISTLLKRFPHGHYYADVCPLDWPDKLSSKVSMGILSFFVGGGVYRHFQSSDQVAAALARCGLVGDVLDPSCFSEMLGVDHKAAGYGRVIDAVTAR